MAFWWYDFPDDRFESPDAVGAGQLRWINSGEISELRFATPEARELKITTGSQTRTFRRG